DIEQTEQRVSHRLQRLVMTQSRKHLSSEHRQQEKKQDGNFEIVGASRPDFGKVIKTAGQHHSPADHSGDFEIRESLVIEHPIKFQEPDHPEHTDQQPKQDLVCRLLLEKKNRPTSDATPQSNK